MIKFFLKVLVSVFNIKLLKHINYFYYLMSNSRINTIIHITNKKYTNILFNKIIDAVGRKRFLLLLMQTIYITINIDNPCAFLHNLPNFTT